MLRLAQAFWTTLVSRERVKIVLLAVSVAIMAGLEVINVSAIMPFLSVAGNPNVIREEPVLSWLYESFAFEDDSHFLVALGVAAFLLMVTSNGWMALTTWMQARFVWSWNHTLSTRLMQRYLYQPYSYFLTRNTADLSKNILSEVQQISSQVMVPVIQGLGSALVAASLVFVLLLAEPVLAIVVTVLVGGIYGLVYQVTRRMLRQIGSERLAANEERFRVAAEALGGIKDVKLLGKEEAFLARFRHASARFSSRQSTSQVIGQLPRYAVEPLAFGSVILIVLYVIITQGDLAHILPTLGFYAFAGYRLMPAVQQAFRGMTQARFFGPALETVLQELADQGDPCRRMQVLPQQVPTSSLRLKHTLELQNVSFRYPGAEVDAVQDLNLIIPARATVGLVGATGSGKTTLVDVILGLLRPRTGRILVDGTPITDENVGAWQLQLGYVPQQIFLADASVAENIAFGVERDEIDMDAVREAARIAMIDDFITEELPDGYDTVVGERGIRLSGGQRQRIGIARALYRNPSVLVFDEATSALDNRTEETVMEAIRVLLGKRTIIMVAHRLTTLQDCDVIYMLDHGRLVARGTYDELIHGVGRFAELAKVMR